MAVSAHTMQSNTRFATSNTPLATSPGSDFANYLASLNALHEDGCDDLPAQVAAAMRPLLGESDWLPEDCCEPGDSCYRRHLLYTDPAGRFTVLALVWRPGQSTPVHGHSAWGAVGVYRGKPSVSTYCYDGDHGTVADAQIDCKPGDVSHVQAGVASPHRIFNASNDIAITIHTYGRDLSVDPASINILL